MTERHELYRHGAVAAASVPFSCATSLPVHAPSGPGLNVAGIVSTVKKGPASLVAARRRPTRTVRHVEEDR
jgi:hypothetical protein